jgi:hypothetical protein
VCVCACACDCRDGTMRCGHGAPLRESGPAFMQQFSPLITPGSKNGAFLDACIIHGSTNSSIDGAVLALLVPQLFVCSRLWHS